LPFTKSARAHRQEPGWSGARCDPKEFGIGQLIDIREFSRLKRLAKLGCGNE
jgi:hypothetical protein